MKTRWLIALGVAAFVATFVLQTPAALLYAWSSNPGTSDVRLHGVHGTLAHGGFSALTVQGRPVLKDSTWSLRPLWLALLQITVQLETRGDAVLRAQVSRTPFGRLKVSDLDAAVGVNSVLTAGGQPSLPLDGQVRLSLEKLTFKDGLPVQAEGRAELTGLAWTLARSPLQLGSFTATLSTDPSGILAVLSSADGPIELDGEAQLFEDRRYDLHLRLRPRPDADPAVLALIKSMDRPDAQGWYHVRRQGALPGAA